MSVFISFLEVSTVNGAAAGCDFLILPRHDWSTPNGQQLIGLLFTDVFPALGAGIQ